MRIGGDDELPQEGTAEYFLELEELERLPDSTPTPGDVRVKALVRFGEFRGSYSEVWLSKPDLERFVEELQALDETDTGKARFEAMSPDEMVIEFQPVDARHVDVFVLIGRRQYSDSGSTYWPTAVSGGFGIERQQLPSVVAMFRTLIT